jgi:hypothetical protein
MKCARAQKMISNHIDNRLNQRKRKQLDAHLEGCEQCRTLLIDLNSLLEQARHLETVEPSQHLWLSIKRRVQADERRRWYEPGRFIYLFGQPKRIAFAAGMLMALICLIYLVFSNAPFSLNTSDDSLQYALDQFTEAEQHYQRAIDALDRTLPEFSNTLPPELSTTLRKNLEIIDNAIRVCRTAVREHPDSQEAKNYLLLCYKKKIELLNEIRQMESHPG